MSDLFPGYTEVTRNNKDPVYWKRGPIKWDDKEGVTVIDNEGDILMHLPLPLKATLNWKQMADLVGEICNIHDLAFNVGKLCGISEQQHAQAKCLGLGGRVWLAENYKVESDR